MVALMEEARAIGELAKTGWKPKRTLVYCAWDAEEPALLGSTEWAEHHKEELQEKAVVYINTDGNGRGFLGASGSHTLEKYLDQVSRSVTDPQKGISVFERRKAAALVQGAPAYPTYKMGAPGAGSDYTPFVHHLGVPIINLGFGGEGSGGEYHTNFDTYAHYTKYIDPGFTYGVTLAQVAGRLSLRMANAEILPFDFKHFYKTVEGYAKEVMKLADDERAKIQRENMLINQGMYDAASDPKKQYVIPEPKDEVPFFNFAPIQNALVELEKSAEAYAAAMASSNLSQSDKAKLNQMLMDMESKLIRDEGLPRRPWYKHHIYAPGFYTGYGVKTFPGVREAIEQGDYKEAQEQIGILGEVLDGFVEGVKKAVSVVNKSRP
jgi:N-acetylated-alpha-linked acidic dipeptidase